jgi:hypothetical protein
MGRQMQKPEGLFRTVSNVAGSGGFRTANRFLHGFIVLVGDRAIDGVDLLLQLHELGKVLRQGQTIHHPLGELAPLGTSA